MKDVLKTIITQKYILTNSLDVEYIFNGTVLYKGLVLYH